ncbi:signal peptidase I [Paenibacillus hamazuiensis]|uniref:signal peptidase I n=1 Tax=Paenibacillus hamazuiensis TaxID=2936508 RepID=UPI00200E5753|nr:signal peptidase I [Paenibacillus hamazuiensis]
MLSGTNLPDKATGELGEGASPGLIGEIWDWFKSILVALFLVVLVHQFGFHLSTVKGSSMQPTLQEDEWLFINKTIRYIGSLHRGDVVIIREDDAEHSNHPYLVKRIVGLPGDKVEIKQGRLYINDEPLAESYVDSSIEDGRFSPHIVEADSYFVMGDNRHRNASFDSRSFGSVPSKQIEGRAEWIVWPFKQIRAL